MSHYGRSSCPRKIRTQVEEFMVGLKKILDKEIIGVYLHGSLAMGCFNPKRSDLDLLVVTKHGIGRQIKRQVIELLMIYSAAPVHIEISLMTFEQLKNWQHPSPYDLHWSE